MALAKLSFCFITFLLFIVACTCSRDSTIRAVQKRNVARTWCVANPGATNDRLQKAIDHYCTQPGVNCSVIKPGGSCYLPNTLSEHASVVLNLYYSAHGHVSLYCPADVGFGSLANPSHGSCTYP